MKILSPLELSEDDVGKEAFKAKLSPQRGLDS